MPSWSLSKKQLDHLKLVGFSGRVVIHLVGLIKTYELLAAYMFIRFDMHYFEK